MIFEDYAAGMAATPSARKLLGMGVRSLFRWRMVGRGSARTPLQMKNMCGDVVMQKYFRDDHLAKKDRRNNASWTATPSASTTSPSSDRETFERGATADARTERAVHSPRGQTSPFTGMIYCPLCGKNYRRKTTHGKRSWQAALSWLWAKRIATPNRSPRTPSCQLQLPVLGMAEFDGDAFHRLIKRIEVPAFNHLVYIFKGWAARGAHLARQIAPAKAGPVEMKITGLRACKEEEPKMMQKPGGNRPEGDGAARDAEPLHHRAHCLRAKASGGGIRPRLYRQRRQLTSYEAQVDYYTHYIKERPDWTFAGMYADEGISGTNTNGATASTR